MLVPNTIHYRLCEKFRLGFRHSIRKSFFFRKKYSPRTEIFFINAEELLGFFLST